MAGIAFSNSMVGMVHTLGHSVGAVCHVPHGVAMSILLPYALEYNLPKAEGYIAELMLPLCGDELYAATPVKDRARKAIDFINGLKEELYVSQSCRARFLKPARYLKTSLRKSPACHWAMPQ
jgi:alcohol dehydrogenase